MEALRPLDTLNSARNKKVILELTNKQTHRTEQNRTEQNKGTNRGECMNK